MVTSSAFNLPMRYSQARTDLRRHLSSAKSFIGNDTVAMVLGDNIFAGHGLKKRLKAAVENARIRQRRHCISATM